MGDIKDQISVFVLNHAVNINKLTALVATYLIIVQLSLLKAL